MKRNNPISTSRRIQRHGSRFRWVTFVMFFVLQISTLPANVGNAAGHKHNYQNVTVPATCTTPAYLKYQCITCNACMNSKVIGPALGHSYRTVTVPATCTTPAYLKYQCVNCNACSNSKITSPALGHNYAKKIAVAPTCTKAGLEKYQCTRCTAYSNYKTLPALGHNYQWKEIPAGWKTSGCKQHECTRCHGVECTSPIPSLSSQYTMTSQYKTYILSNSSGLNYISSSGSGEEVIDEHGNKVNLQRNCEPGDGDGHEWQLITDWSSINREATYNQTKGPQLGDIKEVKISVYRYTKDQSVALLLAKLSIDAAKNDNIGYDQGDRGSYYKMLQDEKVGYQPSLITDKMKCEDDCSSGVSANLLAVYHLLDTADLKNFETYCYTHNNGKFKLPSTGHLGGGLSAAGFTPVFTNKPVLTEAELGILLPGDIVIVRYKSYGYNDKNKCNQWNDGGHAVVNLTIGKDVKAGYWNP